MAKYTYLCIHCAKMFQGNQHPEVSHQVKTHLRFAHKIKVLDEPLIIESEVDIRYDARKLSRGISAPAKLDDGLKSLIL